MKHCVHLLVLLALPFATCAQSQSPSPPDSMYHLSKVVRVERMSGERVWCHVLRADSSGIHYILRNARRHVPTDTALAEAQWLHWQDIHDVRAWKRGARGRSGLRGALFGFASGFILGAVLASPTGASGDPDGILYIPPPTIGLITGIIVTPFTTAAGLIAGGYRQRTMVNGDRDQGARAARILQRWCVRPEPF